jgi:uncharacterized protein YlxW (UPF0749 family)
MQSQQQDDEPGSLVSMLIEVQPDGSKKLLEGDDMKYQQMIDRLEACKAEDIIIGNQRVTYEGTGEGTGDVILYMEDGSLLTKEVYKR